MTSPLTGLIHFFPGMLRVKVACKIVAGNILKKIIIVIIVSNSQALFTVK